MIISDTKIASLNGLMFIRTLIEWTGSASRADINYKFVYLISRSRRTLFFWFNAPARFLRFTLSDSYSVRSWRLRCYRFSYISVSFSALSAHLANAVATLTLATKCRRNALMKFDSPASMFSNVSFASYRRRSALLPNALIRTDDRLRDHSG